MGARGFGLVVALLGGAALAAAVLVLPGSAAPVVALPLEEAYETVVEGSDVTLLDPVSLEQRTGQDVSVSVSVRGDGDSDHADGDTAVRVAGTTTRTADGTLLSTTATTACLDRRSAEAVDCPAAAVDGRSADVRGLTLAFPPGAAARDRMMWDSTARASFPVRVAGTERVDGLEVQRYEHVVPEQVLRSAPVPGVLVGSGEPTAPADILYSATRTLLVEPRSGVVVSSQEVLLTRLRAPDGALGAVLIGGAFETSEESVRGAVTRAREVLERQDGPASAVPWVTGGAGVVLLGLGGVLVARGRALPVVPAGDAPVRRPVPVS